ncbi:MAG: hypothetical protein WDO70_00540 [Alphaproteobacteria bacterium]
MRIEADGGKKRRRRQGMARLLLLVLLLSGLSGKSWAQACAPHNGCSLPILGGIDAAYMALSGLIDTMETQIAVGGPAGPGFIPTLQAGVVGAIDTQINAPLVLSAKKAQEAALTGGNINALRKVRAQRTVNMQSKNCRIHTAHKLTPALANYKRSVLTKLDGELIEAYFDTVMSGGRGAIIAMQRLCRNGQFLKDDFGIEWWKAMSDPANPCFEDPAFAHAFLKSSTILENMVMVQPSVEQMTCLDNPDAYSSTVPNSPCTKWSGKIKDAWDSMTDKQKLYVSAVRFCQNIEMQAIRPNTITGDRAMDPNNMSAITQNFSTLGKLSTLIRTCYDEVARRTAPDPDGKLADGTKLAVGDPLMKANSIGENGIRIGNNLRKSGILPKVYQAYKSDGTPVLGEDVYGANGVGPPDGTPDPRTYVSEALLQYYRDIVFCKNNHSFEGDSGTDAVKTAILAQCNQLKNIAEQREEIYRSAFNQFAASVDSISGDFTDGVASPIRANYEGPVPSAAPQRKAARGEEEAALFKPVALTIGGKIAADVSAPPGAARGERQ